MDVQRNLNGKKEEEHVFEKQQSLQQNINFTF